MSETAVSTKPNQQDIEGVIDVIERHFDSLTSETPEKTSGDFSKLGGQWEGGTRMTKFVGCSKIGHGSTAGLLPLALVGSAERTLHGEVFFALNLAVKSGQDVCEKNIPPYFSIKGTRAISEMNVSNWTDKNRRYIDIMIASDAPNAKSGLFVELGHHSTIQTPTPGDILFKKVEHDLEKHAGCVWSRSKKKYDKVDPDIGSLANVGSLLHILFLTHIESITPSPLASISPPVDDWPPFLSYARDKGSVSLKTGVSFISRAGCYQKATTNVIDRLNRIPPLGMPPLPYGATFLGCRHGVKETVVMNRIGLTVTGCVTRFYCYRL